MPKLAVLGAAKMKSWKEEEKRYQCESDMRCLLEAEKIKKDPARYKAAQKMAKEKMMEAASIAADTDD